MTTPVVVIGGSLCGMAAAARLAAVGHEVILLEREPRLGGRWVTAAESAAPSHTAAGRPDPPTAAHPDAATPDAGNPGSQHPPAAHPKTPGPDILPPVIDLPAPWRDLFKKTGRTLDAELAARSLALTPAPATSHAFPDGRSLALPTDRAEQAAALTAAAGESAAAAWRDLLDGLDDTWQQLRPLGLEAEFPADFPKSLSRSARDNLLWDLSAEAFAARFPGNLGRIVTSVAARLGSDPRRTPAWTTARLAVDRAFGRWLVTDAAGNPQSATVLIDLLAARLATRGVDIRLATPVTRATGTTVTTPAGDITAAAIVTTVNPWQPYPLGAPPRRWRPLRPALAPTVTHTVTPDPVTPDPGTTNSDSAPTDRAPTDTVTTDTVTTGAVTIGAEHERIGLTEHVEHTTSGPIVTFRRRTEAGLLTTVHDHTRPIADPSFGARWDGPRTWSRMPCLRPASGWYTASAASVGGTDPWAQLLSAALACYAAHLDLTGEDIRPTNKDYKPRVHRRPR